MAVVSSLDDVNMGISCIYLVNNLHDGQIVLDFLVGPYMKWSVCLIY